MTQFISFLSLSRLLGVFCAWSLLMKRTPMKLEERIKLISRSDDSYNQFKRDIANSDSLAAEQATFTNSEPEAIEKHRNEIVALKQLLMHALLTGRTRLATFGAPA